MRNIHYLTLCLLILNFSLQAKETRDIEVIEVFGNFNPIAANQIPSPLFVLSEQQIRSVSGSSALDVLSNVPGITIKKSGAVQEIFLRGAETNFVVIQIDGVQVNNPLDTRGGGFDLASIAKNTLKRVEVIKSAQSSGGNGRRTSHTSANGAARKPLYNGCFRYHDIDHTEPA